MVVLYLGCMIEFGVVGGGGSGGAFCVGDDVWHVFGEDGNGL